MAWARPTLTLLNEIGVRDGSSELPTYGGSDNSVSRQFRALWAERNLIPSYFLGNVRIGGSRLERIVPMRHPTIPNFYATRLTVNRNHKVVGKYNNAIDPLVFDDGTTGATYLAVDFTVHYEKPKYRVLTDDECPADEEYRRWMELPETSSAVDVLTVPNGTISYRTPEGFRVGTILFNTGVLQTVVKHTFWWRDLPFDLYDPDAAPSAWTTRIRGDTESLTIPYLGTINKTTWKGCTAGTVLFHSIRMVPKSSPVDGELAAEWEIGARWDVAFEMTFRGTKGGWNWAYYNQSVAGPIPSGYYYVERGTTGLKLPGNVDDNESLYNERPFADLTKVT